VKIRDKYIVPKGTESTFLNHKGMKGIKGLRQPLIPFIPLWFKTCYSISLNMVLGIGY